MNSTTIRYIRFNFVKSIPFIFLIGSMCSVSCAVADAGPKNQKEGAYVFEGHPEKHLMNKELYITKQKEFKELSDIARISLNIQMADIEELTRYRSAPLDDVIKIIEDPYYMYSVTGPALTLGVLGSKEHAFALIKLIERKIEPSEGLMELVRTKATAMEALGLLASRTGSVVAEQWLLDNTTSDFWAYRDDLSHGRSNTMLRAIGFLGAINGLALVGSDHSTQKLSEMSTAMRNAKELPKNVGVKSHLIPSDFLADENLAPTEAMIEDAEKLARDIQTMSPLKAYVKFAKRHLIHSEEYAEEQTRKLVQWKKMSKEEREKTERPLILVE